MNLSDRERREARGHFQADLLNDARTVWPRTTKFGRITHAGIGVFLGGQLRPYRKGAGAKRQAQHILGASLFMHALQHFTQNYLTWRDNMYVEGVVFRLSATPPLKWAGYQRSPVLGVPFYLCTHPLTQNYQIGRCNICEGRALILWFTLLVPRERSSPVFFSCIF